MENKPELFHAARTPRRPPAGLMFLALVFAMIAGYISVFVFSLAPSPAKAANLRQELGTPTAPVMVSPTPNLTAIAAEADAARAQSTAAHDSMRAAETMQAVESLRQLNIQAEQTQAALKLTMQANDATQTAAAVVADTIAAENALKRSKAEAEIIRAEYEMEATNAAIMRDNYIIPGLGAATAFALFVLGFVFLNRIQPAPVRMTTSAPAPAPAFSLDDMRPVAAPDDDDLGEWAKIPYTVQGVTVTKIAQIWPDPARFVGFCRGILEGRRLSHSQWVDSDFFTEQEFTKIQHGMVEYGLAEWNRGEDNPRGGTSITKKGEAFARAAVMSIPANADDEG